MVSYNTSEYVMYASHQTGLRFLRGPSFEGPGMTTMPIHWAERLPAFYVPKIKYLGNPSEKAFIADGARYSWRDDTSDYDLSRYAKYGGAYSDAGAHTDYTKGWNRMCAFDPPIRPKKDPRLFSYRHGGGRPFGPLGQFRLQVGFFDGHTEVMTDTTSANPHLWLPRGATVDLGDRHIYPDVRQRYGTQRITIH